MSQELMDFSEQIDEQFDIVDMQSVESDDFWEAIANLFIWSANYLTVVISNDSERSWAPMPTDFACRIRFLFRPNAHFPSGSIEMTSFKSCYHNLPTLQHSNLSTSLTFQR